MKICLLLVNWLFATTSLLGQGMVAFQNFTTGLDAPVTNAAGARILGPGPYVADLFWSTNVEAGMDSLMAFNLPVPFSTSLPGYFFGGGRTLGPPIPTLVQVRVWDSDYGSNYYTARDGGGEFGFSNLITITPSVPPGTAIPLYGLLGFQLQTLPHLMTTLTTTNTIVFSWPAQQTAYLLQQNLDQSPTNWVTLSNTPVIVGQQQQVVLPVPMTGRMFYRLISQ